MIPSKALSSFAHRGFKKAYFTSALLAVLCIGVSMSAFAGLDLFATNSKLSTGNCVAQPQPGGKPNLMECSGTLYGIRAQRADANRWVEFGVGEQGSLLFWMSYNGTTYSCAAPSTQGWRDAFIAATGASAFFDIWFDPANGTCTSLFSATGSQFKSASSL